MSLKARPYAGAADLPRIFELLYACEVAGYVDAEFRSIGLRVLLNNPAFDAVLRTMLFEDGSECPAAFALLWPGNLLGMLVRPDQRGRLEGRVLEWAVARARGATAELRVLCRDDDPLSRTLYEMHGFSLREVELRMVRDLRQPIPKPSFPEGFTLRSLDASRELHAITALSRESFGEREALFEHWRLDRFDVDYDPALDLVAVDRDGKLAAMCYCSIPSFETARGIKEGRTDPIAVAERYRRLGLGRAMVLSGLRLLKERGMDGVLLTTETDSLPAHQLYESLGYQLVYNACWYARVL